jgi:hypothetical protein
MNFENNFKVQHNNMVKSEDDKIENKSPYISLEKFIKHYFSKQ